MKDLIPTTNNFEKVTWPVSSGEMSSLVQNHLWALTPLGPSSSWPQSLKSAVDLILGCDFPMVVLWASELIQIYNDAYRGLMGKKHPAGLGQPTRDCWPEVWHINKPIYTRVLRGETLTLQDQLFPITRQGYLEQAWFTLCYSPLRGEQSQVAGVLVTVFETTQRLIAERDRQEAIDVLKAKEALQGYLVALGDMLRTVTTAHEIQSAACGLLGRRLGASRVSYHYYDGPLSGGIEREYSRGGETRSARIYCSDDRSELRNRLRTHSPLVLNDLAQSPVLSTVERERLLKLDISAYVGLALFKAGEISVVLNVCDSVPREWTRLEISMIQETAERTWTAIERAQAETAVQEATTQARMESAMRVADDRFRALVTTSSDVLYRMDPTWSEMRYLGSAGFLKETESPLGNWLEEYIPASDREEVLAAIQRAGETKGNFELEHRVCRRDGSLGWALSRAVPLLDAQGNITEWFGAANDITARRQAEEELRQSLAERDALLKEVHHRVKNNLQVITSLLEMQASRAQNVQTFKALQEARNRVASLATMHQLLYQTGSYAEVRVAAYAKQLAEFILAFYQIDDRVCVELDGDGVTLELERAVPLGLLLNELISNSCKHAFPGKRVGSIRIRLTQADELVSVEVADDGIGLTESVQVQQLSSLGMTLIHALAEQMKATVSVQSNASGTTVRVDIPHELFLPQN